MFFQSIIESIWDFLWNIQIGSQISIGDLIALSGFAFAIYQFKKQMKMAREDKEKAQRTEWFLNVIVLPHLRGLHNFYYDLIDEIKSSCDALNRIDRANLGEEAFAVELAERKNLASKLITSYFDELEPLVRSYDNILGNQIAEAAMSLQDICSKTVSHYNQHEDGGDIKIELLAHKQRVLSILGNVMSVNKM